MEGDLATKTSARVVSKANPSSWRLRPMQAVWQLRFDPRADMRDVSPGCWLGEAVSSPDSCGEQNWISSPDASRLHISYKRAHH